MSLGEQFRRFFPGLVPSESRVWRRWLREHEGDYDQFEYNVLVGEGVNVAPRSLDGDPVLQEKIRKQFQEATMLKIDVVAHQQGRQVIIEVEERATARTLGQLLVYAHLLRKKRPTAGPFPLMVLAERIGKDMDDVLKANNISTFKMPPERGG